MKFEYELRIPKDRVAALIGKKGQTKRIIEKATFCKFSIDSKEGDVVLAGGDGLHLFTAKEIITSIGRGFNPEIALLLLKQDYLKEIISLGDFSKSKKHLERVRGRIIGKDGKARELLESYTETHICVYGKTIAVIGQAENVAMARQAIQALVTGSPHTSVYQWLEKKRRELKRQQYM